MTRKHKIFFTLWKLKCWLYGIRTGTYLLTFNESKSILGVVRGMTGDSVTKKTYAFQFQVDWLEPVQGMDNKYYAEGTYQLDDYIEGIIKKA